MPAYCTCEAELPPDALFCHKCGKPQREIAPAEAASKSAAPAQAPADLPSAPGFNNPLTLKLALSRASIAAVLCSIPIVKYGMPLWLFGAGFLAASAYAHRTGEFLSVRAGARIGWVTGIFNYLIFVVVFTVSMVLFQVSGNLQAVFHEESKNWPGDPAAIREAITFLQTPGGVLFTLAFFFVLITVSCTVGGAAGAKIKGRN